jgi:hypothetical protein
MCLRLTFNLCDRILPAAGVLRKVGDSQCECADLKRQLIKYDLVSSYAGAGGICEA